MRGAPIRGAFAAASAFAKERNPRQPFALVTFSSQTKVRTPFTDDPYEIRAGVGRVAPAGGGTHVYDAVQEGVRLVHRAGLRGGFVVVLSDGTDRGSEGTLDGVAATA